MEGILRVCIKKVNQSSFESIGSLHPLSADPNLESSGLNRPLGNWCDLTCKRCVLNRSTAGCGRVWKGALQWRARGGPSIRLEIGAVERRLAGTEASSTTRLYHSYAYGMTAIQGYRHDDRSAVTSIPGRPVLINTFTCLSVPVIRLNLYNDDMQGHSVFTRISVCSYPRRRSTARRLPKALPVPS
jgi:hypothetical protein